MTTKIELDELVSEHQAKDWGIPEFTHQGGDPKRRAILESNYRIREGLDPGAVNFGSNGGFGRVQFRIPEFDYPFIKIMFPDIASRDATTRRKGWQRFARSPLSEPYKVDVKKRRGGIVQVNRRAIGINGPKGINGPNI